MQAYMNAKNKSLFAQRTFIKTNTGLTINFEILVSYKIFEEVNCFLGNKLFQMRKTPQRVLNLLR